MVNSGIGHIEEHCDDMTDIIQTDILLYQIRSPVNWVEQKILTLFENSADHTNLCLWLGFLNTFRCIDPNTCHLVPFKGGVLNDTHYLTHELPHKSRIFCTECNECGMYILIFSLIESHQRCEDFYLNNLCA